MRTRAVGGPAPASRPRLLGAAGAAGVAGLPGSSLQTCLPRGGERSFLIRVRCSAAELVLPPPPPRCPGERGGERKVRWSRDPRCGPREQRQWRGRRRGTCRGAWICCRPCRPWPRSRLRPHPRGRRSQLRPARPSTAFRSRCCGGSAGSWTERPRAAVGGGWRSWPGVGGASG